MNPLVVLNRSNFRKSGITSAFSNCARSVLLVFSRIARESLPLLGLRDSLSISETLRVAGPEDGASLNPRHQIGARQEPLGERLPCLKVLGDGLKPKVTRAIHQVSFDHFGRRARNLCKLRDRAAAVVRKSDIRPGMKETDPLERYHGLVAMNVSSTF